ncbi:MAG TPA: tetratricopeptide repeat-containing glycosyltransferase family protein [Xanthobacteraceae bacterium]
MPKPASRQFLSDLGRTIEEGVRLQRQGRFAEAEKIYTRILKTLPDQFETLQLLAELKMQRGKPGEAFRHMTAAVAARPASADARIHLGHVLRALKRDADALASFDKALALEPASVDALGNRGDVLLAMRRPAEALECLDRILAAAPGHADAKANRAVALAALGRHQEALADFDAALAAAPNPVVSYNRGLALAALGRHAEAVGAYDRTLAVIATHAGAWSSRGVALQGLNRHADAIASFDRALAIAPDFADAHFNKSLALLASGDYPHGQTEYEWRWKRSGTEHLRHNLGRPLWRGDQPLQQKTILLHAEQGLGDTIQFARYAPPLGRAGANVILEVHPELKSLLSRLDGCRSVIARGDARPAYDVHCPLGSLPLAFKTELGSVPADIPYIAADPARVERWRPRLEAIGGRRIALVWAGNTAHINDRNRSIPLHKLSPLWAGDAARIISLQRDLRDGEEAILAAAPVLQLGSELADFDDTAAVLAGCDLVITVDTSVAHLAGAMGLPVWILLPFSADWRWTAAADRSPWYPQARLYRQPQPGDWDSVVARVVGDLPTVS